MVGPDAQEHWDSIGYVVTTPTQPVLAQLPSYFPVETSTYYGRGYYYRPTAGRY